MSERMPNSAGSWVGYHDLPKMKSITETDFNTGKPSLNRKTIIIKRTITQLVAMSKKKRSSSMSASTDPLFIFSFFMSPLIRVILHKRLQILNIFIAKHVGQLTNRPVNAEVHIIQMENETLLNPINTICSSLLRIYEEIMYLLYKYNNREA